MSQVANQSRLSLLLSRWRSQRSRWTTHRQKEVNVNLTLVLFSSLLPRFALELMSSTITSPFHFQLIQQFTINSTIPQILIL